MRLHVSLLFLVAGCTSGKDVVSKNRDLIDGQLAKLQALSEDVGKRPAVTEDKLDVPGGVKLGFDPAVDRLGEFNAAVVYPGFLKDPCDGEEIHWIEEGRAPGSDTQILGAPFDWSQNWLGDPVCLLRKGTGRFGSEPPNKERVEDALKYLSRVKYALVPRLRFLRPTYDIDPDGKVRTFHPGSIAGDLLLYELATAKYLGAVATAVTNAEKVRDRSSTYQALQSDLQTRLEAEVRQKLDKVMTTGSRLP